MSDAHGIQQNGNVRTGEEDLNLQASTADQLPAGAATRTIPVAPGGTVNLPADAVIAQVSADGSDLVITLADGSQFVIPDGALVLPQLVIGDTPIPPANLSALLIGNEPEPAAGTQSSGGNFAGDPGEIQSAFDLGDLLPYTELAFPEVQEEEIIPGLVDEEPEIEIEIDDQGVSVINAEDSVNEAGLPERGEEPEGTDAASDSETTYGFINFASPDGVDNIALNGVVITSVGQTFTTDLGQLTITSIEPGRIGYDYVLFDNTTNPASEDFFEVTITDTDGDMATATLRIDIIDDAPIAAPDTNVVPGGTHDPIDGNVLVNDVSGADDYSLDGAVSGFSNDGGSAAAGDSLQGDYGVLTLNADGSYTYVRDYNTPGGVTDTFSYTIVDQDGSPDTTQLVITIEDAPDTVDIPEIGEGTEVRESHLPPTTDTRDDEAPGSDFDGNSESTTGTITFTSPDGIESVTVEGVAIDPNNLPQSIFSDNTGTLVINDYSYDPVTGEGEITYTYTLNDNTSGDNTSVSFDIVVTDLDGDVAEDPLVINIIDDVPATEADTDSVTEDDALTATGNVITDAEANGDDGADTPGADDADVTGVIFGTSTDPVSGSVGTAVAGDYGSVVIDADGTYTYTLDNTNAVVQGLDSTESLTETFTYTITDGDGDTATTTLTIQVNGADDPVVIDGLDGEGAELVLDEDDLADGSSPDATQLTKTGSFTIDSVDGLSTVTVGGVIVFDASSSTTYPVTIDDPAYGLLTITGVSTSTDADGDVVEATVSYSYVLQDNSPTHPDAGQDSFVDSFEVIATDSDGSTDIASLDIEIVDDVPTANPDVDSVTEDGPLLADGNVITSANVTDANTTDGVLDVQGADGATVTGVIFGTSTDPVAGSVGSAVAGTYGSLTISADGEYAYSLNNQHPLVQGLDETESLTEVFTYTITDDDGDQSTTTVTITINGADDPVVINGLDLEVPEEVVDEDDLPDGSSPDAPALTQPGSFTLDSQDGLETLTIDGTPIFGDSVTYPIEISGDYGLLRITGVTPVTDANGDVVSATINYEYVLSENTLDHSTSGEDSVFDNFEVVATDTDGSSDTASLDIEVVDDIPDATDNSNTVTEGATVGGNVLTDDDGDGIDEDGADGYATEGAVVDVASTNVPANVATVDGSDLVIVGQYGTLTVNTATGAYSYESNANSTNVDAQDVFTYTIRDGDGDESTATLTIDIDNVAGNVSDVEVDVDEAGLPFGSDPTADSEIDANGVITVTNAVGPFTFTLTGTNSDGDGDYGTLVLNANDGTYTYTLDTEYDHAPGDDRNVQNAAESFTYEVRDINDNLIGTGTINVNITDDIPEVDIDFSGTDPDTLTTFDAQTEGTAFDTATGDFSKAFDVITEEYGADGPGSLDVTYAMTLLASSGADTGLNSNNVDIRIYQLADGTVVGSTALSAPTDATDPSVIFSFSVNETSGEVTLIQYAEIDHAAPGDTAAPYDTQLAELASGLVGVTATADIEDFDFDTDSDFETVDLGGFVKFADDGPTIDASVVDGDTIVLETQDADTRGANSDTDVTTANFGGAFSIADSDYGADGAGSTVWAYSLEVEDAVSGLFSDGDPITLYLVDGVVVGSTTGAPADAIDLQDDAGVIFSIAVDATGGQVTLTQYAELDHPDNNDTSAPYDDQLLSLATDLVNLVGTATITDGDGDTAEETVSLDLGGNIKFADDGPSLSEVQLGSDVDVDETDGFPTSDTSLASIISFVPDYGADGPGSPAYSINVVGDGTTSLLTAVGDLPITLVEIDATTIEGQYNGGADTAFIVKINADGTITLTQNVAMEHNQDGPNPLTDHNDTLNLSGLINATVTLTDGDFDEAAATIGIGGALTFYDDGPSVSLSGVNDSLTVSDADFATDDSEDFSDAFTFDGGEDGTASTSYALSVTDGTFSGLYDNATDEQVFLFLEGGAVVGRYGTDAIDAAANGEEVFRVTVDGSGNVTLDQSRAIDHTLSGGDGTTVTLSADNLIQLIGTVEDNDGDTASIPLNIGQNLNFTDDTPTAETTLTAYLDDDTQTGGNPGGPDDQTPDTDNLSGSLVDDIEGFGNDGGTVAFALTGAPTGFQYVSNGSDGVLIQQEQGTGNWVTVVTVTLDPTTGNYTVAQNANIWHLDDGAYDENEQSFTLSATLTDGDGDTAPASLTIVVDDDTPEAVVSSSTDTVDEDGLSGGIADNGSNDVTGADTTAEGSVTGLFKAGADAPLTYSLDDTSTAALDALGLTSNGDDVVYDITGNTITATTDLGGLPVFTFTLNAGTGGWLFTLQGPLDHADDGDSENVTDIVIEFASLVYATDEDGDRVDADAAASVAVTVDDDSPRANADTDSLTEDDASTGGNVVLGTGTDSGLAGADESGADGFGDPIVTAVSGFGGAGTVDGDTTGEWGTLQLNNDGSYTYLLNTSAVQGLDTTEFETDTFNYTIVDADGDEVSTTLIITINGVNDAPVALADTNWTVEDAGAPITGNVILGEDHTRLVPGDFADVADTDVDVETLTVAAADTGTINGTYGVLTLNANGTYSYRLYTELENQTAYDAVQALDENDAPLTDIFNYNAFDGDAESNETSLTISIFGTNDAPVVGTAAVATSDEGLTNGNTDLVGNPTDTTDLATASGNITITDVDDSTFTVTLSIPTESLAVADGSVTGAPITWELTNSDHTLIGKIANPDYNPLDPLSEEFLTAIEVTITDTGSFDVTQSLPIFHSDPASEDVTGFTVDVSVNDGTTTTTQTDAITVSLEDDSPLAVAAKDMTGLNTSGTYQQFLDADNDIDNNLGGDGGRVIFTSATITALEGQNLTSGLSPLTYTIDPSSNGTVLIAYKQGTTTEVFRITLDPDTAEDQYVLDVSLPLDSVVDINFNDGTYDFLGGNNPWTGFVPDGESPFVPGGGAYNDNSSEDLLITPLGTGVAVNGNANSVGITGPTGGQNIGVTEGIRLDYVQDLRGDPAKGVGGGNDYNDPAQQDHSFDGHSDVNGGLVTFGDGQNITTISIKAKLVTDATDGNSADPGDTPDPLEGSSTNAIVNELIIRYDGSELEFLYNAATDELHVHIDGVDQGTIIDASTGWPQTVSLNGTGPLGARDFSVEFIPDGVGGQYVELTTILDTNVSVATYATTSYQALEIVNEAGDDFAITGFGTTTLADNPVSFSVPISVIDNDGDILSSDDLDITLNPPVTPIVLDLDGGGNAFSSLDAGIGYDYDGDGVKAKTAWIAAGSAILAFDANGDGFVSDASEFVFGGDGMTDLEAIAANYDSNSDGVLDASDATYGKFGVWIDADLDGVSDEGEFVSLSDAGIESIELVSDGIQTVEADGDIVVFGSASFTMTDGSTGEVSDTAFAMGGEIDAAMMEALLIGEGDDTTLATQEEADVKAVLSDALAENDVDTLIDQFVNDTDPQSEAHMVPSDIDLAAFLNSDVGMKSAELVSIVTQDMMDDSSVAVAAHG